MTEEGVVSMGDAKGADELIFRGKEARCKAGQLATGIERVVLRSVPTPRELHRSGQIDLREDTCWGSC